MKFSIKFKIVALGAVLSILVTTIALVFANFEYRRRGKNNELVTIDNWLDNLDDYFNDQENGATDLSALSSTRHYIEEQYEKFPDNAPEDYTFEEKKNYYKDRFRWLYAIEKFGMYPMTEEERSFRESYKDFLVILSDTKAATKANTVYVAYVTDDNTLFYVGDEYSYKKIENANMHFPGSHVSNFAGTVVQQGEYYNCDFNGITNRVLPVKNEDTIIAYFFVEYDFKDVEADANSLMQIEITVLSIISLLMIVAYALGAHFLLIRNVGKLTKVATEFSNDLNEGRPLEKKDPHIHSRDEISVLSDSFIALEDNIINYINVIQKETKEREKTNAELNVATSIQLSALPHCVYDDKNVNIRTFIKSAKEIGGDFYDYFYLDDHRLAIVISDVSGKGIPAALFMMKSKELIKSVILSHKNLEEVAKEVNNILVSNERESLFVTSFIGIIDFKKNIITYVNAGHEKPYIVSKDKVIKLDGESNFVMGGEADFIYKQESHAFNKGDFIFLFTDGLNESINSNREEFSYSRIEQALDENKNLSIDKIIDMMNEKLEDFVGKEEQFDDVTMLVVKNNDGELHLSYEEKDYKIINDIVDSFNSIYSYLSNEVKASTGIIIDELVNNLISYEKREDLKIDVDFKVDDKGLTIIVSSNGDDYDVFANHKEKYLEEFDPEMMGGGFGLSIVKDLSESYDYKYQNDKSIVTVVLKI